MRYHIIVASLIAFAGCTAPVRPPVQFTLDVDRGPATLDVDASGEAALYEWNDGPFAVHLVRHEKELVGFPVAQSGVRRDLATGRSAALTIPAMPVRVSVDERSAKGAVQVDARLARSERVPSGQWISVEGTKPDLRVFVPFHEGAVKVVLTTEKEERAAEGTASNEKPWFLLVEPGRYRLTVDKEEGVTMVVPSGRAMR